ncbi:SCO4226 family nickel-binding protein [Pseudarthrobacter sp. P1]|uniref:SCO4226 family nickel-binding protein n=1 Tax=Pseudarthrobacter sp. P1 TaxID=3418418 RepID=UPI003CF61AD1
MPEFMDVHHNMVGISADDLKAAHAADVAIQAEEGVVFKQAWGDPESGIVYCLSEAPDGEAVRRIHERTGHPADEVHPVPLSV